MPTNPTLTELLSTQKGRHCSIEMSSNKPVAFDVIEKLRIRFCSVVWLGSYETPPEEIGPLVLSKELISRGYTVILHITGRNHTKKTLLKNLDYAKHIGIRNLMCVRGASPECNLHDTNYDFPHTPELLKYIKAKYGDYFDMCVAGFPYQHPDSQTLEDDMKYLKLKNDAGAKFVITQAAFSYDVYKTFLHNIRKHGISLQIIPGIYVIRSIVDFCLLKKLCKVPADDPVVEFVRQHKGKDDEIAAYGLRVSSEIVKKLLEDKDFFPPHIYTMNEFNSIADFCKSIKLDM